MTRSGMNRPGGGPSRTGWTWRWTAACLLAAIECGFAEDRLAAYRFGQAEIGSQLTHRFEWPNPGPDPLTVLAAVPSCDCLQVTDWTATIPPGETGTVDITFVPDAVGLVDYRVALTFAPDQAPVDVFSVEGEVVDVSPPAPPRDWSLYVDMPEDEELAAHPDRAVWVDVRAPALFEQARIPGALSIPLHAIKAKSYLQTRPLVLVDEGGGSRRVEEECYQLAGAGFSQVRIWYGGMNAWQQFGGPVEGTHPRLSMDELPPRALGDILGAEDWLVVSTSGQGNGLARVLCLDWTAEKAEEFKAALAAELERRPTVFSVLLVAEEGETPPVLAESVRSLGVLVFRLKGGWTAWLDHRRSVAYRPPADRRIERLTSSPSAPSTPRRRCGGCPGAR